MSSCPMLSYNGVTKECWISIKQAAASYIEIEKDSGSATAHGFTIAWY
jgi:hypothetical protein